VIARISFPRESVYLAVAQKRLFVYLLSKSPSHELESWQYESQVGLPCVCRNGRWGHQWCSHPYLTYFPRLYRLLMIDVQGVCLTSASYLLHAGFLSDVFFIPEDGYDMFPQNLS
jgi:hypothetical protein